MSNISFYLAWKGPFKALFILIYSLHLLSVCYKDNILEGRATSKIFYNRESKHGWQKEKYE